MTELPKVHRYSDREPVRPIQHTEIRQLAYCIEASSLRRVKTNTSSLVHGMQNTIGRLQDTVVESSSHRKMVRKVIIWHL